MSMEADDGTRHLGEPICAACGSGLEYDGGNPLPEDMVSCENPNCGRSATYAEVAADCAALYEEFMAYFAEQNAIGGPTIESSQRWRPRGNYRFKLKIVGLGQLSDFKRDYNAVEVG